jgi:hypothetical protein
MFKTLKEQWGSEVKFTQSLASDLASLNKITKLLRLPQVIRAENEYPIPGGSIDVVGFTNKGEAIVFEHQDQTGRADQTHVGKTSHYARVLKNQNLSVLGAVLMCESIDQIFLDTFKDIRWAYDRRPSYNGHNNIHAVKSQWTEQGEYVPVLFEEADIIQKDFKSIEYYQDFINVYAIDWNIQREDISEGAKTLWFRDQSKGEHYIHKLKSCYKIGIHFNSPTDQEKKIVDTLGGRHNQTKSTFEVELPLSCNYRDIWLEAETLKHSIRSIIKQLDK